MPIILIIVFVMLVALAGNKRFAPKSPQHKPLQLEKARKNHLKLVKKDEIH